MWTLVELVDREGTTKVERAAIALAKAVREFSREPTRGNLETARSAMDKARDSVIGFEDYECEEFFSATKQLLSVYARRAVHFSNNPDAATRERATAFLQEFAAIADHVFRELDAINKLAPK